MPQVRPLTFSYFSERASLFTHSPLFETFFFPFFPDWRPDAYSSPTVEATLLPSGELSVGLELPLT